MKNPVYVVEDLWVGHYQMKVVIADTAYEAREKAKKKFGMQAPKATKLPLKKSEKA